MTDFQKRYLEEVSRRLHCQGFEVWPEYEGILPIEKDARRVCNVNVHGSVSYDPDYVRRNGQEDALDQVRSTAAETMTYMRQMAAAPPLLAEGLSGDYRLLAEFNYIVLAGHERDGGYGVEFVTWERIRDGTALWQGHYYAPIPSQRNGKNVCGQQRNRSRTLCRIWKSGWNCPIRRNCLRGWTAPEMVCSYIDFK